MTTMVGSLYGQAEHIKREAAQLDPLKVAITVLLVVPFVLGYTVRLVWVLISLLWVGAVHGWRVASAQVEARQRTDG